MLNPIKNKSTIQISGFNRMFQEHDDLRKFFKFGDYKESSDLLQNKIFQNHVMLVMHTLDEAICSMGDTDYVMEMLRGVGKSHRRLPEFNFMIFSVSLNLIKFGKCQMTKLMFPRKSFKNFLLTKCFLFMFVLHHSQIACQYIYISC